LFDELDKDGDGYSSGVLSVFFFSLLFSILWLVILFPQMV
jgi:hypothetical protein